MKHDKYCTICRRKVVKLYSVILTKYIKNEYQVCSECFDSIQRYIQRRTL